jgi:hypothetical protein
MSNRFYVNDVQIFGNNEMFQKTHDFITSQGGNWIEDYAYLEETEITDPQGLMDAVTEDSLNYLKELLTEQKKFEDLDDSDLVSNVFDDKELLERLYNKDGTINKNNFFGLPIYIRLENWIGYRRCFTPFYLWFAIKDCVDLDYNTMKITLKKDKKIIAKMS